MSDERQLVPAQTDDRIIEAVKKLVLDSLPTLNSRMSYAQSIDQFLNWYRTQWRAGLSKACVHAYRTFLLEKGLAPASINVKLAAVRKLAFEAADSGYLPHEHAAAIGRIKRVPARGVRSGLWLDKDHALELLKSPDTSTLLGARDYAILCVLVGCGLRREELRRLTFERIQMREGRWCLVDLVGKGNRVRVVPMPLWAKTAIDDYARAAGIQQTGIVFRRIREWKRLDECLTTEAIWKIVKKAGRTLDLPLKPHDLRRTFAKLAYKGNAPIAQISLSLGHANLVTTTIYLGIDQDLEDAPADRLGIYPLADLPVRQKPRPAGDVSVSALVPRERRAAKRSKKRSAPKQPSGKTPSTAADFMTRLTPEERARLEKLRKAIEPLEDRRARSQKMEGE